MQDLSSALKDRIGTVYGSQRIAAERLSLNYDSLRRSLTDNRFSAEDLAKLCRALSLPSSDDELRKAYSFKLQSGSRGMRRVTAELEAKQQDNTATLYDAFDMFFGQARRMLSQFQGLDRDVEQAFGVMGKDDLVVIVLSDELPLEWSGPEAPALTRKLSEVLLRDGVVGYLFPSQLTVNDALKSRAADGAKPQQLFEDRFESFKEQLVDMTDKRLVNRNLVAIPHSFPGFFVTGHKYALFHHRDPNTLKSKSWGMAAYPVATGADGAELANRRVPFPLTDGVTHQLFDFCSYIFRNALAMATAAKGKGHDLDLLRKQRVALERVHGLLAGQVP